MKRLFCIFHKEKLPPQPVVVSTFVPCLLGMCTMHVFVEPILKFIFSNVKHKGLFVYLHIPASCLHGYRQMLLHGTTDVAH